MTSRPASAGAKNWARTACRRAARRGSARSSRGETLPTYSAIPTRTSSVELAAAEARSDPEPARLAAGDAHRRRAHAARRFAAHARARSRRIRTWPTWSSSPNPTGDEAVDLAAVEEGAVRRAEVLDVPGPAAVGEGGVRRGHELVVEHDRVVDVAAEGRHRIEREGAAGRRLPARRGEDDQAPELRRRLPGRRAQVAHSARTTIHRKT